VPLGNENLRGMANLQAIRAGVLAFGPRNLSALPKKRRIQRPVLCFGHPIHDAQKQHA
jgi:hypothetical protein